MEGVVDNELVAKDLPKALAFYREVKINAESVTASTKGLVNRVKSGELETSKGISFLELKSHMLLEYMINTSYIALQKTRGRKIEGDPAVLRLAEIRTVLERMRPIEQKLKYHIDKVVKSIAGNSGEKDPLRFAANPNNLMSKLQDDDSSSDSNDDDNTKKKEVKPYVPPKLAAVHYDDIPVDERKEKAIEQARKKALSSSIMRELKAEYYEGPEEIWEETSAQKKIKDTKVKQRTEYEEDYFVRLTVSKKDKHRMKNTMSMSGMDNLTHFGDISALTAEEGDMQPKRRKHSMDKKGKKKFKRSFKKKKKHH